jgi:Flp pilus assembly protein TadD
MRNRFAPVLLVVAAATLAAGQGLILGQPSRDQANELNQQGIQLQSEGRSAEAEGKHRAAVALQPASAEFHNRLGGSLYNQLRFAEAYWEYQRAAELDPSCETYRRNATLAQAEFFNQEAIAFQVDGNMQDAERSSRIAIDLLPNVDRFYNWLGGALYNQGRYSEAAFEYDRAASLNPMEKVYLWNASLARTQAAQQAPCPTGLSRVSLEGLRPPGAFVLFDAIEAGGPGHERELRAEAGRVGRADPGIPDHEKQDVQKVISIMTGGVIGQLGGPSSVESMVTVGVGNVPPPRRSKAD